MKPLYILFVAFIAIVSVVFIVKKHEETIDNLGVTPDVELSDFEPTDELIINKRDSLVFAFHTRNEELRIKLSDNINSVLNSDRTIEEKHKVLSEITYLYGQQIANNETNFRHFMRRTLIENSNK